MCKKTPLIDPGVRPNHQRSDFTKAATPGSRQNHIITNLITDMLDTDQHLCDLLPHRRKAPKNSSGVEINSTCQNRKSETQT